MRLRAGEHPLDGVRDFGRLRQATWPELATCHLAVARPDEAHAIRLEARKIALRRGVEPHADIHRGCRENGLVGRQQRGRGEIIGRSARHLRQKIGGRRRDHQEIGVARQFDVAHLGFVGEREQLLIHLVAAEARERQWSDEFLAGARQDATHREAAFAQEADELERLIGRDPAADDQKNALRQIPDPPSRRPSIGRSMV